MCYYLSMKTLLISLLVLTGCGHSTIDPQLQPYVDRFAQDTGLTITTPMTVQFGSVGSTNEEGQCQAGGLGNFVITINLTYWVTYDDVGRELLIYHELGHCVLGRVHTSQLDANGSPVSYMYPDAEMNWANYQSRKQALLQELL